MFSAVMLLGVLQSAQAALTIEIAEGVDGALPIAVVPFDTSKLSNKLPVDLAEIVASDLNRSGVLNSMNRSELPANGAAPVRITWWLDGCWRNPPAYTI
jgi:TolB protein